MKTLTKIEAERVYRIMQDTTESIKGLSHIPLNSSGDFLNNINSFTLKTGIEKLWRYEQDLSKIESTSALFDSNDITLLRSTHRTVRSVCKNVSVLKENITKQTPVVLSNEFVDLLNTLLDLQIQTHSRMNSTVEDEEISRNALQDLGDKTRLLEETKKILLSRLEEINYQHQQQMQDLEESKTKLQDELHQLSESNSKDCDLVRVEISDAILKAAKDHENCMNQLRDEFQKLERTLKELVEKNHEDELKYRKEKNKAEAAVDEKTREYNENMDLRRTELQKINNDMERDLIEYNKLKEYFDDVDRRLALEERDRRIIKHYRDTAAHGWKVLNNAVTKIQKIYRGRKARALYTKMKAKRKGKKKGVKKSSSNK